MSLFNRHTKSSFKLDCRSGGQRPDKSTASRRTRFYANGGAAAHSIVALYPVHAIGADDSSTGLLDLMASSDDMAYFDGRQESF